MATANTRNTHVEHNSVAEEFTGVDLSDGDGSVDLDLVGLRDVASDAHANAYVSSNNGIVAKVEGVSGSTITVVLYESVGSNSEMATVANGTDVADVVVQATGL